MTAGDSSFTPATENVRQQLGGVLQQRSEIAAELQLQARQLMGRRRRQLSRLGRWFSHPVTADELLRRPDALAVCVPLLPSSGASTVDGGAESPTISDAVRIGSQQLREGTSTRSRMIRMLIYPLTVLLMTFALCIAASLYLIPEFERMFGQWGLETPGPTRWVIQFSHAVQRVWIPMAILIVLVLILLVALAMVRSSGRLSSSESAIINNLMTTERAGWARWAWHVALLLESGVPQGDAIAIAGQASPKKMLKRWSTSWSEQLRSGSRSFVGPALSGGPGIASLGYALRMSDQSDQAAILRVVAANYWDRDRNRSLWWIAWITPVTVGLVGLVVGFVIVALYTPLLALIEGLA